MGTEKKCGRPEFELTEQDVGRILQMIRIHCTQAEICDVFGTTDKTLNKALNRHGLPNFSELYKKHNGEGKASLRRLQWKAAEAGNPTMLVWLGKQILGQRDKHDLDVGGKDDQPLEFKWRS